MAAETVKGPGADAVDDRVSLVIFASDRGPGDAERTAIMSQAGNLLARNGARIVCLAEDGVFPLALLTTAHLAGADIELVCDRETELPPVLGDIEKTIIENGKARYETLAEKADCLVGLPGSLASVSSLFLTIAELETVRPMVFLNRNRAYEIIRGFSSDVFFHSFQKAHRNVQFVETVEEIWPRVQRLIGR